METRRAIRELDYQYLIDNETDEYKKKELKRMFFAHLKKIAAIENMNERQVDAYWKKELRRCGKKL